MEAVDDWQAGVLLRGINKANVQEVFFSENIGFIQKVTRKSSRKADRGLLVDFARDAMGQRLASKAQVAIAARPVPKSGRALTECVFLGPRAGTMAQFPSGRKIRLTPSERGVWSSTPTLVEPLVWTLLVAGKEDPAEMPAGYPRQTGSRIAKSRKTRFRDLWKRARLMN